MNWLNRLLGKRVELKESPSPLFFTNTLSGKRDLFLPLKKGVATLYSCGPTVYSQAHIGNLRAYVFSDVLARTLIAAGYHVRRVINITDVGHLVGDSDHGEDKMEKGAREEKMTPKDIADQYTSLFLEDLKSLNIDAESILFPRATEYIAEQIEMVKTLVEKGFAYMGKDGVYFDTSRFPDYGKLGNTNEAKLMEGARIEKLPWKRNPKDFVLWRKANPKDLQQWDSPWGRGNPGWHIECSAMNLAILGATIDIHTGGMDHIPVHHNNEIAQSEAANGRPLARYWLHNAFLNLDGERFSKSEERVVYLSEIQERGVSPLALRYLFLQAHYRTPMSFSWDAITAANEALMRLERLVAAVREESAGIPHDSPARQTFITLMRDDLLTPQALSLLWEQLRDDELSPEEKWGLIMSAEAHLGLGLMTPAGPQTLAELPEDIQKILYERDLARVARDFAKSDSLRGELENRGYRVEDSANGTLLTPRPR